MKTSNEVTSAKNKHRRYDVIVAWAEGKQIQFSYDGNEWSDLEKHLNLSAFDSDFLRWRIKPTTVTKRYRMALLQDDTVIAVDITNNTLDEPIQYSIKGFKRWIGAPAEVIVEERHE